MYKVSVREGEQAVGIDSIISDRPDDLYLACASYEPRSTAVTDLLSSSYQAERAIVYMNEEILGSTCGGRVDAAAQKIAAALERRGGKVIEARGSWLDPQKQFEALQGAIIEQNLRGAEFVRSVSLDATTFNREALLVTLVLLRAHFKRAVIRILYVSPDDHGDWLSRGFRSVRSVIGFPGIQDPTLPTALIVLSGFEYDRVVRVANEYEPAKVFLGIGNPATSPNFLERNKEEQKLFLAQQDIESFEFPADSIQSCAVRLQELIEAHAPHYNLVLAPMSTKLSTVGAYLAAEQNPQVQITYCVPGEYNVDNYSTGTKDLYTEQISYGE